MGIWGRGQKFSACSQDIVDRYFFILLLHIGRSNHIPYSQSFSSKQNTSASVPKSSHFLFNSSSPATVQKPVNFIRHICGLGASVGCERIKQTFNTPRLKSQICLIGGNGFVCSVSNELNSNYPNATSSVSISVNPKENNIVPILLCFPADISGISSSTTT